MNDTITVTVRDHDAERRAWGTPGLFFPILRTITLPRLTAQGERRSDPWQQSMSEDGAFFAVSRWTLDSGRVETYDEALRVAK
jgi:hypothetical protein